MMTLSLLFLMLHLWPAFGYSPVHVIQTAGCTDPDLLKTAEAALDKVNKNRREGYIFKLDRLYDFSKNAEVSGLSISYQLVKQYIRIAMQGIQTCH